MKLHSSFRQQPPFARQLLVFGIAVLPIVILGMILLNVLPAHAETNAPDAIVYGTIVNPDGSPIPETAWITDTAFVCLDQLQTDGVIVYLSYCFYTYSDGFYVISDTLSTNLLPGAFVVTAYPPDHYPFFSTVPREVYIASNADIIDLDDPLNGGNLRLTYASFSGYIYNPDGSPVTECVTVWVEDDLGNWYDDDYYCPGAGPYQLGGVPAGNLWLKADGLPNQSLAAPDPVFVSVNEGDQYDPSLTQEIDLFLLGPQLEIDVVNPQGTSVPGYVHIWNTTYDDWGWSEPGFPALFAGLPEGDYWIQAWPDESLIPGLANSAPKKVPVGTTLTQETLFLKLPNLVGQVVTPEGGQLPEALYGDGSPAPYPAEIQIHNSDWSIDIWTNTNAAGDFSLWLPAGAYDAEVYPAYSLVDQYTKALPVSFQISAGSHTPFIANNVKLTYPSVTGYVETPAGDRVSTWVNIWNVDGTYYDWDYTVWDEEKPFRLGGLPAGRYYVQSDPPWDNPDGYGVSNIFEFVVAPGDQYLSTKTINTTLVVQQANFIGTLRYPVDYIPPEQTSCPAAGCPVPWTDVRIRSVDWTYEYWTYTLEDGSFSFSGLDPGDYIIDVFLYDEQLILWDPPASYAFTLASSTAQLSDDLYLQPAVRTKLVKGNITYADNSAGVTNAIVYAYQIDSGKYAETPTIDASGYYEMYLGPGIWYMGVDWGYDATSFDWYFNPDNEKVIQYLLPPGQAEEKTVNFQVARTVFHNVSGNVVQPDGVTPPVDGTVWISLCSDEGGCFGDYVYSGSFAIAVPDGVYEVWMWVDPVTELMPPAKNGFLVTISQDVSLSESLKLRWAADVRTTTLSGRVLINPTGKGLEGVYVDAWTDDGDWNEGMTDADGNYSIPLAPGKWNAGPYLTPEQEQIYLVLPPEYRKGTSAANDVIEGINFYVQRRDATLKGRLVDETSTVLSGVEAIVSAIACPPQNPTPDKCWTAAEAYVLGGSFDFRLPGGYTYILETWFPNGGYIQRDEISVPLITGDSKNRDIVLIAAGTQITGAIMDAATKTPVPVEASVTASDPGGYFVEDYLWPEKEDPYTYTLYVPTPKTQAVVWTLDIWVDPATGYIPDPAFPQYDVTIQPDATSVTQTLYVRKLDKTITGKVQVQTATGTAAGKNIWVYAQGKPGTITEGLYFESKTDAAGNYTLKVLAGEYAVNAYMPPELANTHLLPTPVSLTAPGTANLLFTRVSSGTEVKIQGSLATLPPNAIPGSAPIAVLGWSGTGGIQEVVGTLSGGYQITVAPNTTWYVWAVYEDPANDTFYLSPKTKVVVGATSATGVNLTLASPGIVLPDAICVKFQTNRFKRISLPSYGDMPEPLIEIQAGTIPVEGEVTLCATPKVAVQGGADAVGFAYELELRDSNNQLITQNFNKNVRFIFYFQSDYIPTGVSPQNLQVMFYSTARQEWIALSEIFVDPEDLFVTGKVNHFSRFTVRPNSVDLTSGPSEQKLFLPLLNR